MTRYRLPSRMIANSPRKGWSVIDPGRDGDGSTTPLGCSWRTDRPADADARLDLVIDEQYGIVVTGAIIPGKIYPDGKISAFIYMHRSVSDISGSIGESIWDSRSCLNSIFIQKIVCIPA
ncbi:uncharacterized protein BP01DRAFT_403863 [Aspergillus saccharolyticus JOP 1030-1]|uniref:Uncharacterized protein n=1 Tax=Aspergillus saccharolyticus JOP 1030-1 TaxID=1450539 RepID=A0A319A6E2_9EURO|nr:hypothetical protein BP01DRAFT_403863 [Aspergillus saccharolyticus JOP 1030-1]PYH42962.1 hypothetical protein BP01DRAFT_403863 [Aspergillus saccharolyticus JOP 1030-1]